MLPQVYNPLLHVPKLGTTKGLNQRTFVDYYYRLLELVVNVFEWKNLPEEIDERFLELTLAELGYAVFFYDEILEKYLALTCMFGTPLSVYRIPEQRRAYAVNGYQRELTSTDSVMIFNTYLHQSSVPTIELYARRLYEIERAIDVNVKGQKTPRFILCDESQRMTMVNMFKQYDGNEPLIVGAKNLDLDSFSMLDAAIEFKADKLEVLKKQIWNEALTFLGIQNNSSDKKERQVSEEVEVNFGAVEAQRYTRLNARRQAAEQINKMFGLNIEVDFRVNTTVDPEDMMIGGEEDGQVYNGTAGDYQPGVPSTS